MYCPIILVFGFFIRKYIRHLVKYEHHSQADYSRNTYGYSRIVMSIHCQVVSYVSEEHNERST